ncbi:SdpI family protein [uncultured Mucilaginibacter sp.]|uniref:SdpI family protein n=1 Tax=uncultured Mucilaginibacter sp. TaxID=797541 RepID=UPI0026129985|nr:SdpI family protein [uncultured Mucilaginibacter sp.]
MILSKLIIGPQLIGLIMLLVGLLQKYFPPKKINHFYGYKTPSSMKNQETWDEANYYSAKLMIKIGSIVLVAGILIVFIISGKYSSIITICLLMLSGISIPVVVIVMTENYLHKKFNQNKSNE